MSRYAVAPDHFGDGGQPLRSDVLPVLEAGGHAIYVPYDVSWIHERVPDDALEGASFDHIAHIRDLPVALERLSASRR